MSRRLIALFALHFFLSVGFFAFGHTQVGVAAPLPNGESVTLAHLADVGHEGDLLGSAPDHGLTDSQPDLPEQMQLVLWALATGHPLPTPSAPLLRPHAPPALDGLRRPPRA